MKENEKANFWREQVARYRASGLTMKQWCDQQEVALGQMKYWIRKLGLRRSRGASSPKWIEATPTLTHPSSTSRLTVHVGAVAIEIEPGFDPNLLTRVVDALGGRT